VQTDLRPWRYPLRLDFQYGDWWRDEYLAGDLEPWGTAAAPDLATLLSMALAADRPLVGPTLATAIVERAKAARAAVPGGS
jgi:streptomycin 3"-adenylyltransferase